MRLPALTPLDLQYTASASDPSSLYTLLLEKPSDFSRFIESAADDETWCRNHDAFMKRSLHWFTEQFFEDRLQMDFAKRVADAIRKHHHMMGRWVDRNLVVKIGDAAFPVNSLLWGTSSEWMRQKIRAECRDQNAAILSFDDLSKDLFRWMEEYIEHGEIRSIWVKSREELLAILTQASAWYLEDLSQECQQLLVKYIDELNVLDGLILSHENRWALLRKAEMAFINQRKIGIRFEESAIEEFSFEFLDFRQTALDFFEDVRHLVTKLVCGRRLNEDPIFSEVIHRCPQLQILSVSESEVFSERLLDLPEDLKGLDLSKCGWLNYQNLRKILENCGSLSSLFLGANAQLNYTAWGILKEVKGLTRLDIFACHQVSDQDFKVILQACKKLTHLNAEHCAGLSNLSFFELGKQVPQLTELNLSRCQIDDAGLVDLSVKCPKLAHLNLKKCLALSDDGVFQAVRNAAHLQSITLEGCRLSAKAINQMKRARPYLDVRF